MRIFSMRVALVLLLLSPWRPVKPETVCTCDKDKACVCEVGDTVTLDSAEGTKPVTWTKNGAEIVKDRATYAEGAGAKQKATMTNLVKEDSGVYTATWKSGNADTTASFTVAVAPVICDSNKVCDVTNGHSFKLPSGISSGTAKWAKQTVGIDDQKFVNTAERYDLISQADSAAAGMYVASKDGSNDEVTAFLVQVHNPVTVSVERVAEKQVSLSCIASGSFKELKWKKGGAPVTASGSNYKLGLNNAQLIIQGGPAKAGDYTCVAVQFDGSEKESPALDLSSVGDGNVLLSNPSGVKPGGGTGDTSRSASVTPSYSNALLVLCVLLQLYWMV
ncbi:hemicentin-1-like [Syngnathus typhle]|uniref:hemicentin-1-like n=1 Tax=Syngnathus typhle TaxID=161592 RepID=UPI002A6B6CF5|nr:hemicentin-1-like [Syngnathus typhle]XP_061151994.1 hemicentin-1-like [Syngnathus typhle]XP_061151995.1 hemicentin-1-like [Syngnathus typhle]XP_061151996.1 hemicentin-1-like [Syngnathus typhle]